MKSEFFLRVTNKVYSEIKNISKEFNYKGSPPNIYDIEIKKDFFTDLEWDFLVKSEEKFKFVVDMNGNYQWFNVYKIENDSLFSNESNVFGIANNYQE